jgi:hypothetical protein
VRNKRIVAEEVAAGNVNLRFPSGFAWSGDALDSNTPLERASSQVFWEAF